MTRACFEALVHTSGRAVEMCVRPPAPHGVTGRSRRDTGLAASFETFEPLDTLLLLVHDPGGPAWIRHVTVDFRDNVYRSRFLSSSQIYVF